MQPGKTKNGHSKPNGKTEQPVQAPAKRVDVDGSSIRITDQEMGAIRGRMADLGLQLGRVQEQIRLAAIAFDAKAKIRGDLIAGLAKVHHLDMNKENWVYDIDQSAFVRD